MAKRNHDRAPGQDAISFSCSKGLKEELTKLANEDNRTLSNYLQTVLKIHVKELYDKKINSK